jgi:hypothetical protein
MAIRPKDDMTYYAAIPVIGILLIVVLGLLYPDQIFLYDAPRNFRNTLDITAVTYLSFSFQIVQFFVGLFIVLPLAITSYERAQSSINKRVILTLLILAIILHSFGLVYVADRLNKSIYSTKHEVFCSIDRVDKVNSEIYARSWCKNTK